jgi:phosphoribosyl 1,2-cyclic phosphodiesterase
MTDIPLQKTAKTARRSRGRPLAKGQSGNPAGRPSGSSNRADTSPDLREQLLDPGVRRLDAVVVTHAHADPFVRLWVLSDGRHGC